MKIIADAGRCVGAGQCVLTDPDLFDQSEDDGTVIVLVPEPQGGDAEQNARTAAHICPSQAISLAE
ncbi:ferredoxin [Amycolatopsis regifaucium]|uniref:Ferredoxin n=1 Tax=Amycolatopsis regifaucium TaxID=546365 RepID=A0A154MCI3_9PSEU|nr:ferredoxin [Amycolatopsis regifaucium]KZB82216.1 ferredoxin [Amycolatopsis regifaucium]OKA05715.1 ferredoxin [Amycolatopsis regifaucium]SFG86402.1 Ferredoxin [Amycolatopsis regifaucium]